MTLVSANNSDALTDRLAAILAFVDGHVRFAEGKNAALLALNGATLVALLQAASDIVCLSSWATGYLWMLGAGSALSAVVAMLSFLPVTQMPWLSRPPKKRPRPNLLFFGDARSLNGETFVADLADSMGIAHAARSTLARMYADQIVINSRIAARKFAYFRVALWFTLFAFATPLVGFVLLLRSSDSTLE